MMNANAPAHKPIVPCVGLGIGKPVHRLPVHRRTHQYQSQQPSPNQRILLPDAGTGWSQSGLIEVVVPRKRAAEDSSAYGSDDDLADIDEFPTTAADTGLNCGGAPETGADGAEVGVSRKRAAENASQASGLAQCRGKKARHTAKHAAARAQRIEKSAEADDGGYALKAKGQAQREGVVFAVAKAGEEGRTCLADAVYALLNTLAVVVTKEAVRAALPATEQKDPDQKMAKRFASDRGVDLVHQPRLTGSPKFLLKETSGAFLVRLKITVADDSADFHYVAFDAARALLIDNAPYVKFPRIGEEDLQDNCSAIRPFYHLFPNATDIRIASVLKGVKF